jgi:hypothetical protein
MAALFALPVALRPEQGYGRWGEAAVYLWAALLLGVGLVLPEHILAVLDARRRGREKGFTDEEAYGYVREALYRSAGLDVSLLHPTGFPLSSSSGAADVSAILPQRVKAPAA